MLGAASFAVKPVAVAPWRRVKLPRPSHTRMPTIFRKTAKGIAELQTRAHRLAPRLRSVLILVDGRRDDADLQLIIADRADEALQALARQGFIEVVGETLPRPAPGPALPPARDLGALRKAAARALREALGNSAGDFAARMEAARTPQELKPLLGQAARLVLAARGRAAADTYAGRFPAA